MGSPSSASVALRRNANAMPGDVLLLPKALGVGRKRQRMDVVELPCTL
jgi:hypothetical protein